MIITQVSEIARGGGRYCVYSMYVYVMSPALCYPFIGSRYGYRNKQGRSVQMGRICRLPLVASSTLGPVFQQLRFPLSSTRQTVQCPCSHASLVMAPYEADNSFHVHHPLQVGLG